MRVTISTRVRASTRIECQKSRRSFDFEIRDQNAKEAITKPHRHEFFQIHANIRGDGNHIIGGTVQPFTRNSLVFILPYRIHYTPLPTPTEYFVINFAAGFLRPELYMPPLEMEEVPIKEFPELAPFLFQGHANFRFSNEQFTYVREILSRLQSLHGIGGSEPPNVSEVRS